MIQSKNKPIISVFIHCYPPARGGAEYLAEKFVEVLKQKYDVHVFTGRGETLDSYKTFDHYLPQKDELNIHRLEIHQFIQRIYNKLLNKIIFIFGHFSPFYFGPILKYTEKEIEIIKQSHLITGIAMPTKSFFDAYYFAKKYKKKLILIPTYHDVSYFNRCLFFQKAFDYAHKILFLTPFEAKKLQKNYQVDTKKLFQTTFCPYTKKEIDIQGKKITKNKQKRNNTKHLTIGFIGQITLRKNLIVFKQYLDKYLDYWKNRGIIISVHLAGAKTNSSPEIENLFKSYLDQKIVSIKYDFDNKEEEFSNINIFINPSVEESLGIVNFEAIFYGLPIIIHKESAFEEFINESDKFDSIDGLHQAILNHLEHPHSQTSILEKYNQDIYRSSLNQLISSLIQIK